MLDLVLAPVANRDEAGRQIGRIDAGVAGTHDDRLDLLDVRAEALDEGPHTGDEHPRVTVFGPQAPHDAQAPAHRLDAGAHPLERKRLPRRQHVDGIDVEVGAQVVGDALGVGARRRRDHERVPAGQMGQAGDGDGTGGFRDREHRARRADDPGQAGVVTEQRRQR